MALAPQIALICLAAIVGTVIYIFGPRLIQYLILIVDALWIFFLVVMFSGGNPEGEVWSADTVTFTLISAAPLVYASIDRLLKRFSHPR